MRVAFLGLGGMGLPMAVSVARAGHELAVWNRSERRLDEFGDRMPRRAASIADAVRGVEAAITMLADDAAVEQVVDGGLLETLERGAVHVSMSTLGIDTARELTRKHRDRGSVYVAAPVFGRPDSAAAQKLWIMIAGPDEARRRVRPLLEAMGRGISEFGEEPWRANLVKIGGNFLLASLLEALGEACAMMRKADVSAERFMETINAVFQSPVYANYGGAVATRRHEPALFQARLGLKDVRLAQSAGDEFSVPLPLAALAHDSLLSMLARGRDKADWTVLAEAAHLRAGLE